MFPPLRNEIVAIICRSPEYKKYHRAVVKELTARTDKSMREFWNMCSYEDSFVEGESVDDCVTAQIEAMDT